MESAPPGRYYIDPMLEINRASSNRTLRADRAVESHERFWIETPALMQKRRAG